ncbi:Exodeoxyribonuclease 7 small subunit [Halioglobus japonicus]|nr:Exodeoxyribonuclease 7 small subunit [Halioglobus japonicus]
MTKKRDNKDSGIATFESATNRLGEIIDILEDESTTLEQSLEIFEEAIKLTRTTQKALQEAEQKVQLLVQSDDQPVFEDFEEQE